MYLPSQNLSHLHGHLYKLSLIYPQKHRLLYLEERVKPRVSIDKTEEKSFQFFRY